MNINKATNSTKYGDFILRKDSPNKIDIQWLPKITKEMCNTAIDIFHSNEDKIGADEKRKQAFGE